MFGERQKWYKREVSSVPMKMLVEQLRLWQKEREKCLSFIGGLIGALRVFGEEWIQDGWINTCVNGKTTSNSGCKRLSWFGVNSKEPFFGYEILH